MTDPTTPSNADAVRDPHIDALWRATSIEEPPPALDDALLALARRESGAGPRELNVAAATQPQRWWWPLAAAAVIGVVAIGLLPLYPTETLDRDIVNEIPQRMAATKPAEPSIAQPSIQSSPAAKPDTKALAEGQIVRQAAEENATKKNADLSRAAEQEKRVAGRDAPAASRSSAPEATTNAPASAPPIDHLARNERGESFRAAERENAAKATAAKPATEAPVSRDRAQVAASAVGGAAAVEDKRKDEAVASRFAQMPSDLGKSVDPKPNDSVKEADVQARAKVMDSATPAAGARAPTPWPATSPAPSGAPAPATPTPADVAPSSATEKSLASAASPLAESTRSTARSPARSALAPTPPTLAAGQVGAPAQPPAVAKMRRSNDDVDRGSSTNVSRDVSPAVADWIARLRRLHEEGKLEQARKEWSVFREAHPEALQQLPAELREWLIGKP